MRSLPSGGAVTATYHTLTLYNGLDLYATVTVADDFYYGELTGAPRLRAYGVTRSVPPWGGPLPSLSGAVYFAAALQPAYWPLDAQGKFADPNFPPSPLPPAFLAGQNMQGLTLNFPAYPGLVAKGNIYTPDKNPNGPNDPIALWLANSWLHVGAQGVDGHLELMHLPAQPLSVEMLGDTNSPYYKFDLAQTNFITTLGVTNNLPVLDLEFVDSAVFHSDGAGSIWLDQPTKTDLSITNIAFTSTAQLPGAQVKLDKPVPLDYWQLGLAPDPNADLAGVVSFKTGEIFLTHAGISEAKHFAQPIWFLWAVIYANGAWNRNPILDLNYIREDLVQGNHVVEEQQFDGFTYAPEVFLLSEYQKGDTDGNNAYFQVGGPINFDFFGATYLNIKDSYVKFQPNSPFFKRLIELRTDAISDIGLKPSNLDIARDWARKSAVLVRFGHMGYKIPVRRRRAGWLCRRGGLGDSLRDQPDMVHWQG